jgi:tRNA(adenine34) deaminase
MSFVKDTHFMQLALTLAQRAAEADEVPVGAVVVRDGEVIGQGWNRPVATHDPSAHAEVVALRNAALQQANYRLNGTTLYATLEPCAMCMGALIHARVARLVFGAWDLKAGACGSVLDLAREPRLVQGLDVFGGVCSDQSAELLKRFFERRR